MSTQTRYPTSNIDVGVWLRLSGDYLWDNIDETPASDVDYIYTPYSNESNATFGFSAFSIPSGATITDLSVTVRGRRTFAYFDSYVGGLITVNGTVYKTSQYRDAAFTDRTYTWTTNPNTGAAWTINDINGAGSNPLQNMGVYGRGNTDGKTWWDFGDCSNLKLVVTYSEGATYEKSLTLAATASLSRSEAAAFAESLALATGTSALDTDGVVQHNPEDSVDLEATAALDLNVYTAHFFDGDVPLAASASLDVEGSVLGREGAAYAVIGFGWQRGTPMAWVN